MMKWLVNDSDHAFNLNIPVRLYIVVLIQHEKWIAHNILLNLKENNIIRFCKGMRQEIKVIARL